MLLNIFLSAWEEFFTAIDPNHDRPKENINNPNRVGFGVKQEIKSVVVVTIQKSLGYVALNLWNRGLKQNV